MPQKHTFPWLASCLKTITVDFTPLWILITFSACAGFAVNQFRDHPFPLVYASKAERLQHEVDGILSSENAQLAPAQPQNTSTEPLASIAMSGEIPSNSQELQFLDLATTHAIVKGEKPGLILDARPEFFHRLGHIPGALSFPQEDFEAVWQQHRERIEKNMPHPLVVYCSGASCEKSLMVAAALQKLGLPNVHVFKGGWSDWTAANLPEETTP